MAGPSDPKQGQAPGADKRVMIVAMPVGEKRLEWDPDNQAEVKQVREEFERMLAKGYIAYRSTREGALQGLLQEFDPLAEAIAVAPPMLGG